jgi:hypothetical protein
MLLPAGVGAGLLAIGVILSSFTSCSAVDPESGDQRRAILAVERLGGKVWLGNMNACWVDFQNELGADQLKALGNHLRAMPRLESLTLRSKDITDEALKDLHGLYAIKELNLYGTRVTGRGLAHLQESAHLERLGLYGSETGDEGLEYASQFKNLMSVELGATQIQGRGLAKLNALSRLQSLNLSDAPLADEQLASIRELPALESVDLHGANWGFGHEARRESLNARLPKCCKNERE